MILSTLRGRSWESDVSRFPVFCFLISVPFYVKIPIFPSAHKPLPVLFTRADGVMRTMNTEKLIKTLPVIQNQLDALLDFQVDMT